MGASESDGPARLVAALDGLLDQPARRAELGAYGQGLVHERYSLAAAAQRQLSIYEKALDRPVTGRQASLGLARAGFGFTRYYVRRKARRLAGQGPADDFNAQPVAASGPPPMAAASHAGVVVYLAGAPWHAVAGTDRHLATALGRIRPVVWVDPPVSIVSRIRRRLSVPTTSEVAPGVTRLHPIAPPGVTRPAMRTVSRWWSHALVRRHLRRTGAAVDAVVASSPEPLLAPWRTSSAHRIYFATDDFVAGSELLGLSAHYLADARTRNVFAADTVLAVTADLADQLGSRASRTLLFPNGCDLDLYAGLDQVKPSPAIRLEHPIAGVVGQLNERLDLELVEAVVDHGVSLLLVGPRYEQDPAFRERLGRLIDRPNVQWVDRQPVEELPAYMRAVDVGLTPYADTSFNRASFPLKTLEYLAAGRPVVATALPAARGLDPAVVRLASTPSTFARAVIAVLAEAASPEMAGLCRAEAARFSWSVRATELESIIVLDRQGSAGPVTLSLIEDSARATR